MVINNPPQSASSPTETNHTQEECCSEMDIEDEPDSDNNDPDYHPDESIMDSEDKDDSGDEWETSNYRLEITEVPEQEKYYLVSESSLYKILSKCQTCNSCCIPFIE